MVGSELIVHYWRLLYMTQDCWISNHWVSTLECWKLAWVVLLRIVKRPLVSGLGLLESAKVFLGDLVWVMRKRVFGHFVIVHAVNVWQLWMSCLLKMIVLGVFELVHELMSAWGLFHLLSLLAHAHFAWSLYFHVRHLKWVHFLCL